MNSRTMPKHDAMTVPASQANTEEQLSEPKGAVAGPGSDRGHQVGGISIMPEKSPEEPSSPGGRGGRIDFDGSDDPVEEASKQSFPASDPPSCY